MAVAGNETDVAQGPKFLRYGMYQSLGIAERKIGAAYGMFEENVAHLSEVVFLIVIDHMAWSMAGAMDNLPCRLAHGDRVAVFEPAIRREAFHTAEAVLHGIERNIVGPENVVFVRSFDNGSRRGLKSLRTSAVVEVSVRNPYFLDSHAEPFDFVQNAIDLSARIDDGAFLRLGANRERAVLLEGRDGDDEGGD